MEPSARVKRSKMLRLLVIGAVLVGVVGGCGSSIGQTDSQAAKEPHPSRRTVIITRAGGSGHLRPVPWRATPQPGTKTVNLLTTYNWCGGPPQPRVQRVEIVERKSATVLMVFVFFPSKTRSGVHDQENERRHDASCAEVRLIASTKVTLRQPSSGQALYDGSSSPPTKRWPKS
jgi:hypothetical protein